MCKKEMRMRVIGKDYIGSSILISIMSINSCHQERKSHVVQSFSNVFFLVDKRLTRVSGFIQSENSDKNNLRTRGFILV